jgi:hypothetical protein
VIVEERVQIATSISWVFDRGLADGERHYYFVRVNQVDGDKTWSAPVWVTADVDPAAAPDPTLASAAGLLPCFPNPFTESTTVRFHLPPGPSQEAQIVVTDLQGRRVGGMTETVQTPGYHQWSWRSSDRDGAPLPAGIYFIELRLGGERAGTTRAVLTR